MGDFSPSRYAASVSGCRSRMATVQYRGKWGVVGSLNLQDVQEHKQSSKKTIEKIEEGQRKNKGMRAIRLSASHLQSLTGLWSGSTATVQGSQHANLFSFWRCLRLYFCRFSQLVLTATFGDSLDFLTWPGGDAVRLDQRVNLLHLTIV